VLRVLRAAAAAGAILSAIPPAAREGWEDRYRLTRRGLVGFAERAPDRLLLTSNESGAFQLETRDLSTGEKHVLTAGAAGRTAGAIAPDGKFVYYVEDAGGSEVGSWVRVPFGGGRAQPVAPGLTGSSTGIAFDSAGRFVVIGTSGPEGFRFDRIETGGPSDAAGGNPRTLYRSKNEAYGPALSANGKYLSLVETERKNDRHYATLILDAATGARVAELWDGEGNSVTAGRWSPITGDERLLVASDATGFLRPEIYDARGGGRAPLAADLTGEVTAEDWSADARTVLLKSHAAGRDRIFLSGVPSTKSEPLATGEGSIGSCGFRPDGSVWAMLQYAAVTPRLVELDRKGVRRTIFASDDAPAGTPLSPVVYPGGAGENVPALLGIPTHPNGAAIVWLHGGPHSETADAFSPAIQAYLDEGYTVLAPNYHGSSGLGRQWANSVVGDPMRLELEDFRGARDYLVGRRLARPGAVFIAGWSYGGYGVLSALTRQAELWAGGIAGAPITDFSLQYADARAALRGWTVMLFGGTPEEKPELYRDRSPLAHAGGIRAPLLILAGKNDRRAPARQVEAFVAKLEASKKDVTVRWFDAGHGSLASDEQIGEMRDSLAFLRKAMR
jgi:dipeptidyl aminopeptidase/acylaminoacyl peptidase